MTITLLTILLALTIAGLIYQSYKLNQMQKNYINSETLRAEPIKKEIIELEAQNEITLEYVQKKQEEFEKLEAELKKKRNPKSISVDDALKILGK